MNLNQSALTHGEPIMHSEPEERPRLRVMRLPQATPDPDLVPFDGGEELPREEVDGQLPLIDDEPYAVGLVDKGFTNELPLHTGPDAMDQAMDDLRAGAEAFVERIASGPPEGWSRHHCVLDCGFYLDVPPVQMGALGTPSVQSLEYQAEAEQRMVEHVEVHHGTAELIGALHQAQRTTVVPKAAPVGVQEGVIPGPAKRDPARQAAIDALDRRLAAGGRGALPTQAPQTAEEKAEYDSFLRARREARRAQNPSAYDLTPKYTQDIGDGVVGIKR